MQGLGACYGIYHIPFALDDTQTATLKWVQTQVGVRVEAEDMRTGLRYHCCSAYLSFVSLRSRAGQATPARVSGYFLCPGVADAKAGA